MTNQLILTKAIAKAIAGGWLALNLGGKEVWLEMTDEKRAYHINNMIVMGRNVASQSYPITIFNHDFAKALWGENDQAYELHIPFGRDGLHIKYVSPKWQYHLQQMVIADDPIKYLGENI